MVTLSITTAIDEWLRHTIAGQRKQISISPALHAASRSGLQTLVT